jgi:hypothetical protein
MAIPVLKTAPAAIVLVAAGVCAWPYLGASSDDAPAGPPAAPPTEIAATLLEPAVGTNFDRDPFQEAAAARLALARVAFARLQARAAGWFRRRPADGPAAAPGPVQPIGPGADLVLNGTFLQGERHLAMINGRVYAPGEALKGLDEARGRYVLAEVRPLSVVIDARGRRLELSYRGPSSTPQAGAAKRPAVSAGKAALRPPAPRPPAAKAPAGRPGGRGR